MFETKFQSVLWISVCLLCGSACGSQNAPLDDVAAARGAALTNKTDDDKDGRVDENDEGLDEDEDGHVDESGEHSDACKHRHRGGSSTAGHDDSDADAGVDEDSETDEGHEHRGHDDDQDSDEGKGQRHDKTAEDIAAIDCSDVPSTSTDDTGSEDDTQDFSPVDAGA